MLVGAMAFVAAACSSGDEATETVSSSSVATTEAASPGTTATEAPANDVTTSVAAPTDSAPALPDDAPPAPDFTLALDDGSEFVLSAEQKPVYVVFWAEW
jgi:hypothetical protein